VISKVYLCARVRKRAGVGLLSYEVAPTEAFLLISDTWNLCLFKLRSKGRWTAICSPATEGIGTDAVEESPLAGT
jgi:hypothetical protein